MRDRHTSTESPAAAPPATANKVSVVLRTYEHAHFIAQAIESVLIQQTPFRFELVIGEDCSTDGTREIVEEYAQRHPQSIKAVLPPRNIGHGEILRDALGAATGELIAYLDGDDYWTSPDKLARQVAFLEQNPDCTSCFHDVSLIYDEAGVPSGALIPRLGEQRFTLEQIVMECFVPAPTMMFRREVAEALPDWTFDSPWIDWLIHIRAAQLGSLGYLPLALAAYRVHRGGMFSGLDRVSQLEEDVGFYRRLALELPEQRELIERCVGFRHAQLAIERLEAPFNACIVLVDPRRELRPYFNGRHARSLPRRDGNEITELEAIREATCALPAAILDYGSAERSREGSGNCYAVVPRSATDWLDGRPQVRRYLDEHGEVAWQDEWVVIHEMRPPTQTPDERAAREACEVEATMLALHPELAGAFLEAPTTGAALPAHAIHVVGWVVGRERAAIAVEFEVDGEVIWRAPIHVERPDVSEALPDDSVGAPGFETTLNLQEHAAAGVATILAVLAGGVRAPFAELRRRDREARERPEPSSERPERS
jgi:glycosyltransferase involved in cell wall biosynthesis